MQIRNVNPPIQVTGRHVSVTEAMKEYSRRRVTSLHLDYPKIIEVQVILGVQKYRHQAEVILHCSNHITIEASAVCNDMYGSIDQAIDKVSRQMRKWKTRMMRNHRPRKQPGRKLEKRIVRWEWLDHPQVEMNGAQDEEEPPSENGTLVAEVIRTERTALKPMSVDEAVLQMELTPKRFLVFLNAKTETVNVLYRRKSGEFGLVEPTLG